MNHSFTFHLDQNSPLSFGKISYSVQNDTTASTDVFIAIASPIGVIKLSGDPVTVDFVVPGSGQLNNQLVVDIPVNQDSERVEGDYVFIVKERVTGTNVITESRATFNFCAGPSSVNIQNTVNCLSGILSIRDETAYGSGVVVNRNMTIVHPIIPGVPDIVDTTTALSYVNINFTHVNVLYQVKLEATTAKTTVHNDNYSFVVTNSYNEVFQVPVSCEYDICKLMACLIKYSSDLESEAKGCGGYGNLSKPTLSKWMALNSNIVLYNTALSCRLDQDIVLFFDKIKSLINCDCSCGTTSQPVAFTPIYNQPLGVINYTGFYPVIVLNGEISLDPAFIQSALEKTITPPIPTSIIEGTPEHIVVGTSVDNTDANFPVTTYKVDTYRIGWIKLNDATLFNYSTAPLNNPFQYRVRSDTMMDVGGRLEVQAGAGLVVVQNIPEDYIPDVSGIRIWCYNPTGDRVGFISLVRVGVEAFGTFTFTPIVPHTYVSLVGTEFSFSKTFPIKHLSTVAPPGGSN